MSDQPRRVFRLLGSSVTTPVDESPMFEVAEDLIGSPRLRVVHLCQAPIGAGMLCCQRADFVDARNGYFVCVLHALTPQYQELLIGRMVEWHRQDLRLSQSNSDRRRANKAQGGTC
jgi:hypothetical protein